MSSEKRKAFNDRILRAFSEGRLLSAGYYNQDGSRTQFNDMKTVHPSRVQWMRVRKPKQERWTKDEIFEACNIADLNIRLPLSQAENHSRFLSEELESIAIRRKKK